MSPCSNRQARLFPRRHERRRRDHGTKRYAETDGWGYYNFNHSEPKAPTAKGEAEVGMRRSAHSKRQEGRVWTNSIVRLDN